MILSYSFQTFPQKIISGEKIHTLREDPKNRWKVGMSIQHWFGSPRNQTKNPYQFADGELKGKQRVCIIRAFEKPGPDAFTVFVDGKELSRDARLSLVKNDGLTVDEFIDFFVPMSRPEWRGYILHFTELKY